MAIFLLLNEESKKEIIKYIYQAYKLYWLLISLMSVEAQLKSGFKVS